MRILANKKICHLYISILVFQLIFLLATQIYFYIIEKTFSDFLFLVGMISLAGSLVALQLYFRKQDQMLEDAVAKIQALLAGDIDVRLDCDEEGELFKLFSQVNNLSAVLNSKVSRENDEKVFLKNTISDISHQLKTPLAALNIYNGILEEAEDAEQIREFVDLSEKELDRIETLVQNLLKITRIDAGSLQFHKTEEKLAEMIRDIELHFAYRAKMEGKKLVLTGEDSLLFFCDRDWMIEAIENLVKNALDHTAEGDSVWIEWKQFCSLLQIKVRDSGFGIHPEDIHHIFKRFYRSRFSKDSAGLGLGLSLTKSIVEAHGGTIEVDSEIGKGTTFTINFLIPTK